jgi:hypothetical protein
MRVAEQLEVWHFIAQRLGLESLDRELGHSIEFDVGIYHIRYRKLPFSPAAASLTIPAPFNLPQHPRQRLNIIFFH